MRVLLLKTYLNAQEIQQMVFSDTRINRSKTNITCITVIITPPYVEHNIDARDYKSRKCKFVDFEFLTQKHYTHICLYYVRT